MWETPVPIPNTTVKTQAADGTALETVWESRWLPAPKLSGNLESMSEANTNLVETYIDALSDVRSASKSICLFR